MFNVIIWILFGALAGWIASLIMNTDSAQGPLVNIVLGIIGAIIGGFITQAIGLGGISGFNVGSLIIAVFGAVILLGAVKLMHRA